ncbi:hypothetical protein Tco_0097525 [Tanacetum coccineum]
MLPSCLLSKGEFQQKQVVRSAKMSRCHNWKPLVDRFHKRLLKWESKSLSFGGRLTLVRSVLGSLGVYYFSNFKAPKKVIFPMGFVPPLGLRFQWAWKRELLNSREFEDLSNLVALLSQLSLSVEEDSWEFTVGAVK